MRVGLYGGTFDPIHNGHVHVIEQLIGRNIVDRLLVVPAGQPRLREHEPKATGDARRQMCQLAINSLAPEIKSKVEVNPIEVLRAGPSYTIDTVQAVAQTYPDDSIVVVVGTDAYTNIDQWHRADELKKMVEFVVIDRPDFPGTPNLDVAAIAVSATQIREHSSDAVPAAVAAYIKEHNLYASK
ncbi:MAG: nicotinate (nicotinamide) nucleotide adenylyltransferase [Candidatus Planktophila sp.]|nr:nicotinate (nicotinamide) nucleotide adenylyltransferase [Candidatus Planktophila sp.]MSO25017.1 nicotinate (nicotinamide) nucleotide adenylyltransferase [Candidatus Planktophila sp.]PHX69557.1 MAG: nicotinate (nicotinamide) nucleotide adenylyltransferase [Actinomycetota bacterium]